MDSAGACFSSATLISAGSLELRAEGCAEGPVEFAVLAAQVTVGAASSPGGADNSVEAVVERVLPHGPFARVDARVSGGGPLLSGYVCDAAAVPEPGAHVRLSFPASAVRTFPAAGDTKRGQTP